MVELKLNSAISSRDCARLRAYCFMHPQARRRKIIAKFMKPSQKRDHGCTKTLKVFLPHRLLFLGGGLLMGNKRILCTASNVNGKAFFARHEKHACYCSDFD